MLEEERRLFYVGITRAERSCTSRTPKRGGATARRCRPCRRASCARSPSELLEQRRRPVRAGRAASGDAAQPVGATRSRPRSDRGAPASTRSRSASGDAGERRVTRASLDEAEASQDAPRVRRRVSACGTASSAAARSPSWRASGRETKVKIDFDDEAIGRKTLVVAFRRTSSGAID